MAFSNHFYYQGRWQGLDLYERIFQDAADYWSSLKGQAIYVVIIWGIRQKVPLIYRLKYGKLGKNGIFRILMLLKDSFLS